MTLRLLDLFSGFGMFSLGLERSGVFTTQAFCEVEPYPRRVLAKHWPGVRIFPDVRELKGEDIGSVDAICGGFPCQDISFAGRGAGIGGERSGLWGEYARLIGELRPGFVLVENVAALLVRGLDRVLGDLAALGYDAWWDCIPAAAVGAPHRRDRLWLVAYANHAGRRGIEPGRGPIRGNPDAGRHGAGGPVADASDARPSRARGKSQHESEILLAGDGDGKEGRRAVADAESLAIGAGFCEGGAGRIGGRRSGDGGGAHALADANRFGQSGPGNAKRDGSPIGYGETGRLGSGGQVFDADAFRNRLEGLLQGWPAARATDGFRDGCDPGWWLVEPELGRVAHGIAHRVERLSGLGNGLVPTIPYLIGTAIGEALTFSANDRTQNEGRGAVNAAAS